MGFTIVELLVVIAIIAILMGLLVSGLRGAIGSGRKTQELSLIRGMHTAWQQYADLYDGQLLPGYLDPATQTAWNVSYKNSAKQTLDPLLAATYAWRLQPFLGKDAYQTLLGYAESTTASVDADRAVDWNADSSALPTSMSSAFPLAGSALALQPAFGYNAYYVGGWYTAANGLPEPAFSNAQWTDVSGGARRGGLVATRQAQISRTTELVIFASGTYADPGKYRDDSGIEDHAPGAAWVVPPRLGQTEVWQPDMGNPQSLGFAGSTLLPLASMMVQSGWTDTGVLSVMVPQCVPLRRYNRRVAVVHADGSTISESIGELMNMRHWIDAADQPDFVHQNN